MPTGSTSPRSVGLVKVCVSLTSADKVATTARRQADSSESAQAQQGTYNHRAHGLFPPKPSSSRPILIVETNRDQTGGFGATTASA